MFPIQGGQASWTPYTHHDYPATDLFAATGCGTPVVSPVTGKVGQVLLNRYVASVDDPALRGGNAVSVIGNDGVRYYMAHFERISPSLHPGSPITAGTVVGWMGETGKASACHMHFGLSLPCPNDDWWTRRGVIWPDQYLTSWRNGGDLSPLPALRRFYAKYPHACRSPQDVPYPIG